VVDIKRMPSIGSDHFPVMTTLQYEPEQASKQQSNAPTEKAEDVKEAKNTIEAGKKEGCKVSKEHAEAEEKSDC